MSSVTRSGPALPFPYPRTRIVGRRSSGPAPSPHPRRVVLWFAGLAFAALLAGGCRNSAREDFTPTASLTRKPAIASAAGDEHSYAQPEKVVTRHLHLELAIDFATRRLRGAATLDLAWNDPHATELVLDSRDLEILGAEATSDGNSWKAVAFDLGPEDSVLGRRLTLHAGPTSRKVRLQYQTSPGASGLQWLTPGMTLGKRLPLLFSQSQPIHARSWVPLQDTPAVRFTYEAQVSSPTNVMVLMSADNDPRAPRTGRYRFRMPQPIPSYLLAIAAGDLVFQPITSRIGIWAEPAMVSVAANEFADTGRMMTAAEGLYGKYRWDRYDLLVLPPSFPYGGMENPRLTFASPTVITGDRSLVSLVAHELAHSWSGNLVTSSSHRDLWLNEGVTTYVENRILEELYGREQADMENVTARHELEIEFTDANRTLQPLILPPGALKNPEDHLTGTIYTKGAWFMQFLEQRFGRATFDTFLRGYFEHFAFQSIASGQFEDYARRHLLLPHPGMVRDEEFKAWLYEPGIPRFAPRLVSPRLDAVDATRRAWLADGTLPPASRTASWSTQEWLHFLAGLPETLADRQLQALDAAYHFTGTPNVELANVWYPLTIRSGYIAARPAIDAYLNRVGRRRMVLPTYRAFAATPEGRALGREILARARDGLHPITLRAAEAALAEPSAPSRPSP